MNDEPWLLGEFSRKLAGVIESITGEKVEISSRQAPPAGDELWWQQDFTAGTAWVGCPPAAWEEVGRRGLRAAGIDSPELADVRQTFLEILSQALAALAGALGVHAGREVGLDSGREQREAPPGAKNVLLVKLSGQTLPPLPVVFDADLAALCGDASPAALDVPPPIFSTPIENSRTLDLLMEVEMPVSVSFGRSQMALKDVLKLSTGSIVELNRSVSEPVELIVNNCVVARGEVVVVEGNYGVRIQQIISPQERLRTLS